MPRLIPDRTGTTGTVDQSDRRSLPAPQSARAGIEAAGACLTARPGRDAPHGPTVRPTRATLPDDARPRPGQGPRPTVAGRRGRPKKSSDLPGRREF